MSSGSLLLLLRVATTWALPGLGLLALPEGATPLLSAHPLHTALAVTAVLPDGTHHLGTATIEEVTRPGAAPPAACCWSCPRPGPCRPAPKSGSGSFWRSCCKANGPPAGRKPPGRWAVVVQHAVSRGHSF